MARGLFLCRREEESTTLAEALEIKKNGNSWLLAAFELAIETSLRQAIIFKLKCIATPAATGCTAVLPTITQCTATPSTAGCVVVLPTLAECTLTPSLTGCSAILPTLAQCASDPGLVGCGTTAPTAIQTGAAEDVQQLSNVTIVSLNTSNNTLLPSLTQVGLSGTQGGNEVGDHDLSEGNGNSGTANARTTSNAPLKKLYCN
jgi:hypothetical protein